MSRRWMFALGLFALAGTAQAAPPAATSCRTCHADPEWFDAAHVAMATGTAGDVHTAAGISCHHCHGGNPDPATAADVDASMDPGFAPNPFRGAPARAEVPAFCGSCHSSPEFMKRFRPDPRVDQEREYWTSHHGEALRGGDTQVATCVDCHSAHGIRAPGDTASPVHATRVAETCARCHADAARMAAYGLPTDQLAGWKSSVHAQAMHDKGDLSAPTCNDCHGNHGAAPPGLTSVSFVCGQCHGREAELFRQSPKRAGFEEHNAMLADAGSESCAACHDAPQAALVGIDHLGECASCHGNHAVVAPRMTMLAPLPDTPCALCHEPLHAGAAVVPELPAKQRHYVELRDSLLAEAGTQGLTGVERFDWLIDRARALPTHTDAEGDGGRALRPEFERLFTKFRLGKTTVDLAGVDGALHRQAFVKCDDCHGSDDASGGLQVARELRDRLQELTALVGRAERIVLAARRGGVEVGDALADIDAAVDAQIELQVLVHTFDSEGAFAAKQTEGIAHATAALAAGQRAVDELGFRRRGLGIALGFIALVLLGLALKIRQLGGG
jgi:hypothetical protein